MMGFLRLAGVANSARKFSDTLNHCNEEIAQSSKAEFLVTLLRPLEGENKQRGTKDKKV